MSSQILSITQVNEYVRSLMDRDGVLTALSVKGEISNYKVYPSGHHYFTLKDESSALRCVLFKGNAMSLRFRPENGMKVIAMGRVSVYPRDGAYQLYCTTMIVDGVGDLYAAFEQLKKKLEAQGLFDPRHKKPIPKYPQVVGVVTSSAGAAIHDILRILRKRYPICSVRLFPVRVQGAEAPGEIAAAIAYANARKLADVLIVGRGGGSIEDLWAFNDELVAQAIYRSEIPVISAVGHEPDVTIADYVADLRAATPSNAAELAVPDQEALRQTMDSMSSILETSVRKKLMASKEHLRILSASPAMKGPTRYISILRENLEHRRVRLVTAHENSIRRKREKYISFAAKMDAMSPLKVLSRGYSITQTDNGSAVRSVKDVKKGDRIRVTVSDGKLTASITDRKENG